MTVHSEVSAGLWRDDSYLVARIRGAEFPHRCVRCNKACDAKLSSRIAKRPRTVFLILGIVILGPFLPIFFVLFAPSARLALGLCKAHRREEIIARRSLSGLFLVGGACVVVGFLTADLIHGWGVWVCVTGFAVFMAAAIIATFRRGPLNAINVDRHFIWLDNVHHDLVTQFPEVSKAESTCEVSTEELATSLRHPPKIEGWLILPALGLVLGPPLYVTTWVHGVSGGYLGQVGEIDAEFPGFLTALAATTLLDVVFFSFQIYVAVRFFKKHASVPRLMIILMLASLGLEILACLWFTDVFQELDMDRLRGSFGAVIACCIWVPYFTFSKRVKATFIVGRSVDVADNSE